MRLTVVNIVTPIYPWPCPVFRYKVLEMWDIGRQNSSSEMTHLSNCFFHWGSPRPRTRDHVLLSKWNYLSDWHTVISIKASVWTWDWNLTRNQFWLLKNSMCRELELITQIMLQPNLQIQNSHWKAVTRTLRNLTFQEKEPTLKIWPTDKLLHHLVLTQTILKMAF